MAVTELNDGISDKDNRDKLNNIEFASAIYLVHHSARLSMHIIRHHVNYISHSKQSVHSWRDRNAVKVSAVELLESLKPHKIVLQGSQIGTETNG